MTHSDHFYKPVFFLRTTLLDASTALSGTQRFQTAYRSRAMWPFCDFTSSADDVHNTDNSFLLLFAVIAIAPTLLEGLSEIDVPHTALGCRFALDIFTISQQLSPTPDHEPLPHDPEFATL